MSVAGLDWARMRSEVPSSRTWAYFDHAAVSPLPAPTYEAIREWLEQATHQGSPSWPEWNKKVQRTRQSAARLLGADAEEIAFVPNTTTGISLVAEGWKWEAGDNVVTLANEFPSNAYPWLHLESRGVEVRRVPVEGGRVDLQRLAEACDQRTRIVAVSWVGYGTGYRLDLDQVVDLAHRHQARLFVDAIQGLGVFPLDLSTTHIDFLAADGHKWLMGPEGAGIFYVRRENLELLRPMIAGWQSVSHPFDYARIELRWRGDAGRFEGGSHNMAGILGLGASLDWLEQYGWSARSHRLAERLLELTAAACQRIECLGGVIHSDRSPQHASGIVSFSIPDTDPVAIRKKCLAAAIVLSCRDGRLRISPHAYANADDLNRLVECLRPK
jgi:cysteine desulfurase / selenocysteine lyase